jgi:DNA-binding transcriptional MocR family regulator
VAPLPIKHWDKHGWVLWCGSISKTIGAGYRLGWCEAGRYLDQYLSYLSGNSFGVNNIAQITIAEFISSGQYAKHLKKLKLTLASHALDYHQLLRQSLGDKAKISAIQGGLVLWVQVVGLDSEALLEKANDASIYIKTGKEFTSRSSYKDCFRLNIGWPLTFQESKSSITVQNQLVSLCELVDSCS